jgi:hypothetical protein
MSAVTPAAAVDQLARALQPHTVLVHHDFSQTPDFPLRAPNVQFVPDPRRTGWASFGFVEGIFHSMRHALAHLEFDYLQLLSPTCLPIKPIASFEAHVAQGQDAHFGAIDLLRDRDCLMSVGYRAFTPEGTLRHRVLRRLSSMYFAGATGRRDEAGVWIHADGGRRWSAPLARALTRLASRQGLGRHPFGTALHPFYGSVWFGARQRVVDELVRAFSEPQLHHWASRLRISEEFLMPSLLMRSARTRGPLNHYISPFDNAHPRQIDACDLPALRASPAFFARKYPQDAAAAIRLRVLDELVMAGAPALPAAGTAPLPVHLPAGGGAVDTAAPRHPVLPAGLLPALDR